jgi:hypothetical protein
MLNLDKSGGWDFPALAAINPHSNLPPAGESSLLLPKTLSTRSFKIFGDNGIAAIL